MYEILKRADKVCSYLVRALATNSGILNRNTFESAYPWYDL